MAWCEGPDQMAPQQTSQGCMDKHMWKAFTSSSSLFHVYLAVKSMCEELGVLLAAQS